MTSIRHEVLPFIGFTLLTGAVLALVLRVCGVRSGLAWWAVGVATAVLSAYFLYFFRNPPRTPPANPHAILAGADGSVARISLLPAERFCTLARHAGLNTAQLGRLATEESIRISIFLSLFDVHVNRAPITGRATFLGYFPGKHFFTFQEKSSDHNQHNSILLENDRTLCLINQIVGPVCRRVVYWLDHGRAAPVTAGETIGMMKFGSRLDMYLPAGDVTLALKDGDIVRAGETVIAHLKKDSTP